MRVTLIGARGFVGSAFARYLRTRADVELVEVTRQNYRQFAGARSEVVIDAAGNSKKYWADQEPLAEFEASVAHRLRTLLDFPARLHVHLSSVDVYGELASPEHTREDSPVNPARTSHYGCHKLLAEELVRHYASGWMIVRLAGMVGPGLKKNPVFDILNGHPLRIGPDSQYQFLHTDDVARIVWGLAAARKVNEVFNICGDGLISPRQIAQVAGKPLTLSPVPTGAPSRVVNVCVEKIKALTNVPRTVETIRAFVRAAAPGHPS